MKWCKRLSIKNCYFLLLFLILMGAGFNVFYQLGIATVDNWDEARHGVNAYEMLKNHNYLVNTYLYERDYYNLKPPISYWAIMVGYRLFGYNLLGLRVLSGVAAIATILLVAAYTKRAYGALASLLAAGILATTCQYVLHHCARTGDADALFVLFFSASLLALALLRESPRWLYLSGLCFSLAFLTKSWHSFPILAVIGTYLCLVGSSLKLRGRDLGIFCACAGLPLLGWGILRFSQDGWAFFKMMIQLDLLARSSQPLEGHVGGWGYYFGVVLGNYGYWLGFAVLAWLVHYARGHRFALPGKSSLAIILWILVPFLLFTVARTKLAWYVIPIYPAVAIALATLFSRLIRSPESPRRFRFLLCLGVLACLMKNEGSILIRLLRAPSDHHQATLQQVAALPEYRGFKIFTMCGTYGGASQWDQSHLLCVELYGDLKAQKGGMPAFLRDDSRESLLWIPRHQGLEKDIQPHGLKLVLDGPTSRLYARQQETP